MKLMRLQAIENYIKLSNQCKEKQKIDNINTIKKDWESFNIRYFK